MKNSLLTAVLEPRRRQILAVLDERGGLPVGELARGFEVSRPAISQHLAVLKEAGLVEVQSEQGRNTYRVVAARRAAARAAIARLGAELPGTDEDEGEPAEPAAGPAVSTGRPPDLALEASTTAPPEAVFAAAATVAGQAVWLGEAEADAKPGGRFRVDLGGDTAAGTYVAVDPPARLAFGWGQEGGGPMPPDASRVELRFTPAGEGTLIRLEHRGLPPAAVAPHLGSWAHHLPRLVAAAEAAAARR